MRRILRHSAAALVALASLGAAAQQLGTLFQTPEERARLDRLRRGEPLQSAAAGTTGAAAAPEHRPAITGYVQRSDGRNTVWIDGRPVLVASPNARRVLEPRLVQPGSEPPAGTESPKRAEPR
ncbi:MAG TPA: hypothetical protein VFP36_05475 [Usitatibacter sp.]|nr:hypothetical protein [Usitatibacter sp.]